MPLTAVAFWLPYVSGLPLAVAYPIVGVLVYVLVYHLNPESQWWGASVRSAGIPTSMAIALATLVGIALRMPRMAPRMRQIPPAIWLSLLLLLVAVASLSWGYGFNDRGAYQVEKFAKILVFLLIMVRCASQPGHYHLVVCAWLAGVLYICWQAYGDVGTRIGGRLSGGLGGPDFAESSGLAAHLTATLPLIAALFFTARRWWTRMLLLAIGALTVNAIVLTRTRNAIIGVAAAAVVAALSLPRGYRLRGCLGIVIGAALAYQLTDPAWWNRMNTLRDYQSDASATSRLAYWDAALTMAWEHPLGIGVGNFRVAVQDYVEGLSFERSALNTILTCLSELGARGLALLLAALWVTLRGLTRVLRRPGDEPPWALVRAGPWQVRFHLGWHALAVRSGLAAYLACGMFTSRLWTEGSWLLIGMAACLMNIAVTWPETVRAEGAAAPAREPITDGAARTPPGVQPA